MTEAERDAKLLDFVAAEDGMPISAGGLPFRELLPRPSQDTRTVTLDLSDVPAAARPGLADELRAMVRRAAAGQVR